MFILFSSQNNKTEQKNILHSILPSNCTLNFTGLYLTDFPVSLQSDIHIIQSIASAIILKECM